jgi:hypothetical protein
LRHGLRLPRATVAIRGGPNREFANESLSLNAVNRLAREVRFAPCLAASIH